MTVGLPKGELLVCKKEKRAVQNCCHFLLCYQFTFSLRSTKQGRSTAGYKLFVEEIMIQSTEGKIKDIDYSITHWFQPIYDLKSNSVIGYEALLRDASEKNFSPISLFNDAKMKGFRELLDVMSIKKALDCFKEELNVLFINVFPSSLMKNNFLSWWDMNYTGNVPVVLELLENDPIDDWEKMRKITKELQYRGVKIAIDDVGAGYSFFQQWIELEPDYIKLDKYFASCLSKNPRKQKIISFLVKLFSDDLIKIIIEGIENEADLCMAEFLGISYAQGYFLGKPSPLSELYV